MPKTQTQVHRQTIHTNPHKSANVHRIHIHNTARRTHRKTCTRNKNSQHAPHNKHSQLTLMTFRCLSSLISHSFKSFLYPVTSPFLYTDRHSTFALFNSVRTVFKDRKSRIFTELSELPVASKPDETS